MSTTVDERVLSMKFDNKQFEQNVSTTLSTLDKLKEKLHLPGASKGLEQVNEASKRVDMTTLGNGVEAVRMKFSALQIMGVTALANITNSAINTGKQLVKSLTIDPIKTGLAEYETQLNSVQTILANTESKGSTLEDVNGALDELNAYADKTIYNFTEMTRNIGTFTAAGVDLDTSVSAIKGIANLAAVSGSTSQQASTAMYQLSQALASGTVKLMDWNSVVNAGMGGQVFQDALKETARVHGVAIDNIIEKNGSFRESLQEGWLTSEILTETLSKFTGDLSEEQLKSMGYTEKQIEEIIKLGNTANDAATKVKTFSQLLDTLKEAAQSGWAQTWEIIIGDFEEAKKLWTKVSDVIGGAIGKSADARNALLSGTLDSGWQQLLGEGVMDEAGYKNWIKSVAKNHGVSMDEMIKETGSFEAALKQGLETGVIDSDMLSEALNSLTNEYGSLSAEQLKNLGYTSKQVKTLQELNKAVQNGSISMEEYAEKMKNMSGRELLIDSFKNLYKALTNIITPIKEAWSEIFPATTSKQLYGILEAFNNFTKKIAEMTEKSDNLKRTFKGLFAALDIVLTVFKTLGGIVARLFGNVVDLGGGVLGVTASFGDFLVKLRDTIKESGGLAKVADVIVKTLQNVVNRLKAFGTVIRESFITTGIEAFGKVLGSVWNIVKSIFGKIGELLSNTFTGDGDIFASIFNILSTGGLLMLASKLKDAFSSIGETISGFKKVFSDIFGGLGDTLQAFQDKLKAEALKKIGIAIALVAASLLILSLIDEDKLESALAAMVISLGILIGALALIGKLKGLGLKSIGSLISIASSLLILSLALKLLGTMSWSEIGRGLTAMVGTMVILAGALALLSLVNKIGGAKNVKQLRSLAKSLIILGLALKIMGSLEWSEIGRGLTAMAGTLVILTGILALLALTSKIGNKGAGKVLIMSISLIALGAALKIMGSMEWSEIGRGLTAMAGALGILVGILALLALTSKIGHSGGAVIKLMALTASMVVLSLTLKLLGTMEWDQIGRGLTAMAGALGILVGVLALMSLISKISGGMTMIASAAAILIMSAAIATLVPSLLLLGSMKTGTIVKSLITVAAALAIFGVAGLLLKSVAPAILALTGSMFLFGASLVLVGAGVALISVGLATLITSLTALLTVIVSGGIAITSAIIDIVKGVVELIPLILVSVATGIVEFCRVIAEGAPVIGNAIAQVLLAAINACVTVIPELATGLLKILLGVLDAMVEFVPKIVAKVVDLLIGVLTSIGEFLPKLIQAGVDLFVKFFTGIIDALKNIDSETLVKTLLSVGLLAALMAALSAIAGLIPGAMLGVLGMGAVIAELALVLAAVGALARIPGLVDIIADGGKLLQTVGTAIGQFIGGIIGGVGQGITSSLPKMGADLSNFMTNLQPFIEGIKLIDSSLLENGKTLASLILTITASSIIERLTAWLTGGRSMAEFGEQLVGFGKGIKNFANEVQGIDAETVRAAAEAGKNLGEMAKSVPTSGGLWDLIAGKNDLNAFGNQLVGFGKGVKNFANEVQGVDGERVKAAAEAGRTIGEMAKTMPTSGGLWDLIAGENDISSLGNQIGEFGKVISTFSTESSNISVENVQKGVQAGKMVSEMASTLPTSGGLWGALTGTKSVGRFGEELKSFASAIKNFAAEMQEVGNMSSVVSQINMLNSAVKSFTTNGIGEMVNTLQNAKGKISDLVTNMLQGAIDAVKNKIETFTIVGKSFMEKFILTIKAYKTKVKGAFLEIVLECISSIRTESNYNKFYSTGKYFVEGFAAGISDNDYLAEAKAKAMAKAAAEAAAKELDEHSPSKVGYEIGDFFGIAFVNAIDDYALKAYSAGSEMGTAAKTGLQNIISKIGYVLENGIDTQPTISPVLDLSGVQAGAGAINSMFDMAPSVGVMSKVNSISSTMNNSQNGGNSDVVSAIDSLKDSIQNSSGNSYVINGLTYEDGSEIQNAIETIVRAIIRERRV